MAHSNSIEIKEFDTIIVGSGLAGLTAAFHASKNGNVAIITKSQLDISNSYYAQGGIAVVTDENDSFESHIQDTLVAGRGLCDLDAVKILVTEGQECVLELIRLGMKFDQENGQFVHGLEGGHSYRRILHAGGDATGKGLTSFMLKKVQEQKNIIVFEYTTVVELLVSDKICTGVQAFDFVSGNNILFRSKATIIATGGLSRIYDRSTNPHTATGDGIALAYYAGAKLSDIEFIQFHPSALYIPGEEAFLISEAVRGEGAWLLNPEGERFMQHIHPLAELAPRDVVAYAIYNELQKHHSDFLYLSLKHLNPELIKKRFSNIYNTLLKYNYDITTDLLPISPAAHYTVGGIQTGLHAETNIDGLFACGEVASTGVMGANRLASNSLLECLVFGKRAAEKAMGNKHIPPYLPEINKIHVDQGNEKLFLETKNQIAVLMSKKAGIVRSAVKLSEAIEELALIKKQLPEIINEYNLLKINHITDICTLICESALIRTESRGGHIREDYQTEDPNLCAHLIQQKGHKFKFQEIRKSNMNKNAIKAAHTLIDLALMDDVGDGDITTNNIVPFEIRRKAKMVAKAEGVVAGLPVAEMVFRKLDPELIWNELVQEGQKVKNGDVLVEFEGVYRALLTGERTALNFLQRLSGIATMSAKYAEAVKDFQTVILDTRKTLPGFNKLDKYAVKTGGASNHRHGLHDMAMIKDNHIEVAGGITAAVKAVRSKIEEGIKIEVETTTLAQVQEAIDAGADIIMLDNMDNDTMRKSVELIAGRAKVEASGNMTFERLHDVAATGVDFISIGALTHSVTALDISQRIED